MIPHDVSNYAGRPRDMECSPRGLCGHLQRPARAEWISDTTLSKRSGQTKDLTGGNMRINQLDGLRDRLFFWLYCSITELCAAAGSAWTFFLFYPDS